MLAAGVDHVSAYALIVEDGTALARRVRRGELPAPDDDVAAARYELIDERLTAAGLRWYEVSNWAASTDARCRHNLGYWLGGDWWGVGPGRALARGREPVVEREAPGPLRGPARGGGVAGGGARGADGGRAGDRSG